MGTKSRAGRPRELSMAGSHHVVVSSTDRTLIKRLYLPDGETTVVWKAYLGSGGPDHRRREHGVLLLLAGLPGVSRLSDLTHPDAELKADEGGRDQAYAIVAHEIDLASVQHLAHRLPRVIAGVHARGVVHKDINPANVVVDDAG